MLPTTSADSNLYGSPGLSLGEKSKFRKLKIAKDLTAALHNAAIDLPLDAPQESPLSLLLPFYDKKGKANKTGKKSKSTSPAKTKKARTRTPLGEFRYQTVAKRKQLTKARKAIDRDLKRIEKDLGVLKRKK